MASRPWRALDVALALGLTVTAQAELAAMHSEPGGDTVGVYAIDVALALITTLSVAVRRWSPAAVPAVVFGISVFANVAVQHAQPFFGCSASLALLSFTLGRHAAMQYARFGWVAGTAWVATFWIHTPESRDPGSFAFQAAIMVLPWAAGWTISRLHTQRNALDRALAAIPAAEEERRQRALIEERTRIAREMHDVLAHGVSVMVVQAGAARLALPPEADEARDGMLAVESTGRNVLQELRRTVGLLRAQEETASVLPAPGFAELPGLTQAMREAGLEVELRIDGSPPEDKGLQLAVYRVVQEALTNCLRHAGPTQVGVTLTTEPDLVVRVEDQGRRGPVKPTESGGNGLRGLRERVGMYGGTLEAGSTSRGFVVQARIPMEAR